jgi:hypothetical protein
MFSRESVIEKFVDIFIKIDEMIGAVGKGKGVPRKAEMAQGVPVG